MNTPTHSVMAESAALARAAHQVLDAEPLVFPDPLAVTIVGATPEQLRQPLGVSGRPDVQRRARTAIVVRSAFAEGELRKAMEAGACQYVILGAGLDTFAYRRSDLEDRLTVYEVDQPGTQAWKRQRLAAAGIPVPAHVRYVPVDFNAGTLADALARAGFRRDLPAVFSWLGVTYYLPHESITGTLRFMGGQDAASTVVFDFAVAESEIPAEFLDFHQQFAAYNRTAAERWLSWYTTRDVRSLLTGCGFSTVEHLDFQEVGRRFLAGRSDGLSTGPLIGLVAASRP